MPHLSWSPRALGDVQRIYRFLARKDQAAAKRAVAAIRNDVARLIAYPRLGRSSTELGQGTRRLISNFGRDGYVILYRLDGEHIRLLSLHHQRENEDRS
jgi:plasmid stabilization system protein ParE